MPIIIVACRGQGSVTPVVDLSRCTTRKCDYALSVGLDYRVGLDYTMTYLSISTHQNPVPLCFLLGFLRYSVELTHSFPCHCNKVLACTFPYLFFVNSSSSNLAFTAAFHLPVFQPQERFLLFLWVILSQS